MFEYLTFTLSNDGFLIAIIIWRGIMINKVDSFSPRSVLYYPTIEFQTDKWVKNALLFWDKIYRIVPSGYNVIDSDQINIAVADGFIQNIELTNKDLEKTADHFERFCNNIPFYPAGFDSRTYDVRLHSDKIDVRLKSYFKDISGDFDKDGFIRLPQVVANGYMFYLSDVVSKRRGIAKLTDNPDMFAAMMYFDGNGDFNEILINEENPESYINIIIERLLPVGVEFMDMRDVINLNSELAGDKRVFRDLINGFSERVCGIEDQSFLISELEDFRKSYLENKMSWQEKLYSITQELIPSLLYVGLPTAIPSVISAIEGGDVAEKLSVGLFAAFIATIASQGKDIRASWNSKKSNYYLELKERIGPSSHYGISNMYHRFDEYVND